MKRIAILVAVLVSAACATTIEPPPVHEPSAVHEPPAGVEPPVEAVGETAVELPTMPAELPAEPPTESPIVEPEPAASTPRAVVEMSPELPRPPRNTLGTRMYAFTEAETAFGEKLAEDEHVTGSMFQEYAITGKAGAYVGWFGIVRGIREDVERDQTRMLVEMKYFDGLTDTHIQCVSFNGAGDFVAILDGRDHGVRPLSLVKAYGTVASETDGVPRLECEYLRVWDQGRFTFMMAYGKQSGNVAFRKLNIIKLDDIYAPFPDERYYRLRLGRRALFESGIIDVP